MCTHFFLKAVMRVDLEVWPLEAAVGVEDVLGRKRNGHTIEYHVAILPRLSHPQYEIASCKQWKPGGEEAKYHDS